MRLRLLTAAMILLGAGLVAAGESPVGRWKTVDEKTGKTRSVVEVYEQGGKLFGRIASIPEPLDKDGRPKVCAKCVGADKDKPIIGLVIIKDLAPDGERYKGGTILDPEDGKVYKAQVWVEDGALKVRGYVGIFFRTQTWPRAN
jgi:hypothetical protein